MKSKYIFYHMIQTTAGDSVDDLHEKLQAILTELEQPHSEQQEIGGDKSPEQQEIGGDKSSEQQEIGGDSSDLKPPPEPEKISGDEIGLDSDDRDVSSSEESLPSSQKKRKFEEWTFPFIFFFHCVQTQSFFFNFVQTFLFLSYFI